MALCALNQGKDLSPNAIKIPAYTIIDVAAKAHFARRFTLTLNAINLTNRTYLVSRHPSGLRPGHPLGIFGGIIYKVN